MDYFMSKEQMDKLKAALQQADELMRERRKPEELELASVRIGMGVVLFNITFCLTLLSQLQEIPVGVTEDF